MIELGSKARVLVNWNVSMYDYSKDKEKEIVSKISKKYSIPKEKVRVSPQFLTVGENGEDLSVTTEIIQNIQDPIFQQKLFKEYLSLNDIKDYDFERISAIDAEINAKIDYQVYDKYRRYCVKWVKWDNFLSYGSDNFFDFTKMKGLVLLSGEPANQSGKTTFAIDLLHFLLYGKTTKVDTLAKVFNKHIPNATQVLVEGCITIDGEDYIIKRTITRPALSKRSAKSKVSQKVEYYKIIGDTQTELEEYVDNQQEENSVQTNKVIKEAIGRESDFDLIMSISETTLDELVKKKEAERGRLLSRWIGLLPIEEKEALAREKFNSEIKPSLISNLYSSASVTEERDAFLMRIETLTKDNAKLEEENKKTDTTIANLEQTKQTLSSAKKGIDTELAKIDIATLSKQMEECLIQGKTKKNEHDNIVKELKELENIEFSIEEYESTQKKVNEATTRLAVLGEKYSSTKQQIEKLKKSEYCPTCGRKLDNVDNSSMIETLSKELSSIGEDGRKAREESNALSKQMEELKNKRLKYEERNKIEVKQAALELNLERLRSEYKDLASKKKEYEKNSEAIDKNNEIELQIRNTDELIRSNRECFQNNLQIIARNKSDVESYKGEIKKREDILKRIAEEEKLVKNWKIYLDLVGKNGITKMVLRKALPIINAQLVQLLSDVCDFDIEVAINSKNDVVFNLIKDGVRSDLNSGSGFELTASALALRAVLADMSTIPRMCGVVLDEVWGRVARDNYDNMRHLIEKISKSYEWMFLISHLNEVKDWCESNVVVTKENNISKIAMKC